MAGANPACATAGCGAVGKAARCLSPNPSPACPARYLQLSDACPATAVECFRTPVSDHTTTTSPQLISCAKPRTRGTRTAYNACGGCISQPTACHRVTLGHSCPGPDPTAAQHPRAQPWTAESPSGFAALAHSTPTLSQCMPGCLQ